MIELEFDQSKAYGDAVFGREISFEDYQHLPIVRWCVQNIGPMYWPRKPGDRLAGDGWTVEADWSKWMSGKRDTPPRTVLQLAENIDPKLVTEFWMKFGI